MRAQELKDALHLAHHNIAAFHHSQKFDHAHLDSLAVTEAEIEEAEKMVSQELKDALHLAHHNIAAFHHSQSSEMRSPDAC